MKTIFIFLPLFFSITFSYSQCVTDTLPPTVICNNITVQLNNTGTTVVSPFQLDNGSFDNCGIASMRINGKLLDTFDCNHLGNQMAILTAIDTSGNQSTCAAMITIQDTIAPINNCSNITVYLDHSGLVTVTPNQINNGSSDNCAIVSLSINGQASQTFSCANIGISSVVLTATDASGNTSSCTSTITIQDTIAPISNCNNITIPLNNAGIAVVNAFQIDNGSSDNCAISSISINGQDSILYNCTNIGTSTAVLTVTDMFGNSSSCVSTITIEDQTPPIVNCQNITIPLNNAGVAVANAFQIDNGSSDNCAISSMLINGQTTDTFSCADIGINTAVLTVIDIYGNTDTCSAIITVTDSLSFCGLSNTTISHVEQIIDISPNPVQEILHITSKESFIQQVTLSSITGQVILTQQKALSQNTTQLDLRNLPNAIYLLTITTNKGFFTKKIVKN